MNRWLLATLVVSSLCFVGCSAEASREVCGDGVDNDGNGLVDCDDRDCAGQAACTPVDYGSCAKCSQPCSVQSACVTSFTDDRPIPLCVAGKCTATETFIQPRIELDTRANWSGLTLSPQSASTRFIKKVANDGSAVSCATVATVAADRNAPSAIEDSNKLIIQGLDVTRVTNPMLGQGISFAFVNTQTGGNYLIWVELWGGPPNSTTKLPTGRRFGYGCYEDAATTPALTVNDNCPSTTSDAGVCKTFKLVMPGPEMP
jgi:hypothetical protein